MPTQQLQETTRIHRISENPSSALEKIPIHKGTEAKTERQNRVLKCFKNPKT